MSGLFGSLQARLFGCFAALTLAAAILPFIYSRSLMYENSLRAARENALAQAESIRGLVEEGLPERFFEELLAGAKARGMRYTLADAGGRVLRDSEVAPGGVEHLDNHNDRPEIAAALEQGKGFSLRRSNTLGYDLMYAAVRLQNGGTLRVGIPFAGIQHGIDKELTSYLVGVGGVVVVCLLLSMLITRLMRRSVHDMAAVVEAISLGYYKKRLRSLPGREFAPLAQAVNRMAENIEASLQTTRDQQGQLETILDTMQEGVLVLGGNGNIRRYNRTLAGLFPLAVSSIGRQVVEAVAVPALQRRVEELLRREPGVSDSLHFELPPGRFLVAHLSRPLENDPSLGAVIVFYDATEIMRLERVRRDFVTNVSHELRTPLTVITGYAETLMSLSDMGEAPRRFAETIYRRSTSLAKIIEDLLSLSRLEHGRDAIPLAPTDPRRCLEEALQICKPMAGEKKLAFAVHVEGGASVQSNGPLLTQIFRNLLENACRYSPLNGEIAVVAERRTQDMLFRMLDNGPGIPEADLERIFERFYQVEKARAKSATGSAVTSGIGLALCRHIIERHGGRIWAESPVGQAASGLAPSSPGSLPGAWRKATTALCFTLPLAAQGSDSALSSGSGDAPAATPSGNTASPAGSADSATAADATGTVGHRLPPSAPTATAHKDIRQ